jgi:8-oxo-dGTP pyrophosphatase MutT (NUDIX family)
MGSPIAHRVNRHGAVMPDPAALPADPVAFGSSLEASLSAWQAAGHRSVLLELPIASSVLIPVAVALGFVFHHSDAAVLTLLRSLTTEPVFVPSATHTVGAGGVVINEHRELLVVWETADRASPDRYKLPGGYVDAGEHIGSAVEREVFEETGVRSRFESMVCLRHWHLNLFGSSNLYFVCRLSPLSREIRNLDPEIHDVRWMPVDKYLASDGIYGFNKRVVELALRGEGMITGPLEGYDRSSAEVEIFYES